MAGLSPGTLVLGVGGLGCLLLLRALSSSGQSGQVDCGAPKFFKVLDFRGRGRVAYTPTCPAHLAISPGLPLRTFYGNLKALKSGLWLLLRKERAPCGSRSTVPPRNQRGAPRSSELQKRSRRKTDKGESGDSSCPVVFHLKLLCMRTHMKSNPGLLLLTLPISAFRLLSPPSSVPSPHRFVHSLNEYDDTARPNLPPYLATREYVRPPSISPVPRKPSLSGERIPHHLTQAAASISHAGLYLGFKSNASSQHPLSRFMNSCGLEHFARFKLSSGLRQCAFRAPSP